MTEATPVLAHADRQRVALVLATHLSEAKIRRKTARKYANEFKLEGLSKRKMRKMALTYLSPSEEGIPHDFALEDAEKAGKEQGKIEEIKQKTAEREHELLEEKAKGGFSTVDRVKVLFKAKSKRLSGLGEEERVEMYKAAGYTEKEIEGITGKKFATAAAITTGLAVASLGARVGGSIFDKLVPLSDVLPGRAGVAASIAAYTGSYLAFAGQNLRLTKSEQGTSANAPLTVLYYAGNRLVSNRTRDLIAMGLPTAANTMLYGGLYTAVVEGTTGSSNKVVAANVMSTVLNLTYATGAEAWIRLKAKKIK